MRIMQDKQQFEQLMLQYNQLKNGSLDIRRMIEKEEFDAAMTMIKSRDSIFLNCKCMRNYLELTPEQENELNIVLDELRTLEQENMQILQEGLKTVSLELKRTNQVEKFQKAYDFDENHKGSIINYSE